MYSSGYSVRPELFVLFSSPHDPETPRPAERHRQPGSVGGNGNHYVRRWLRYICAVQIIRLTKWAFHVRTSTGCHMKGGPVVMKLWQISGQTPYSESPEQENA